MPYSVKILYLRIKQAKSPSDSFYYNYNTAFLSFIIILLIILSVIILQSGFLLLLSMILLSSIMALGSVPANWRISFYTKGFLGNVILFLLKTGNLKYFFFIYEFWHGCLTFKGFKGFTIILHSLTLFHLIVVRYLVYLRMEHLPISITLQFLYALGCFFVFLRFITNFSFFIIHYTFSTYPEYAEIMLTEIPDTPNVGTKPPSAGNPNPVNDSNKASKPQFRGWFNFHNHHHHYPSKPPSTNFYRNCGLGFAAIGLGFSAYACYNYRLSALAAIDQANAAIEQADVAKVQAGLITKEEYYKRHPKDKP